MSECCVDGLIKQVNRIISRLNQIEIVSLDAVMNEHVSI
ncbi:hypothetical protein EV13_1042 [Prochlorococcus sp. MIT 0702]|nr:hypothetical protein EV13_1042 [Prochlorococcus sp. MIT 0702]